MSKVYSAKDTALAVLKKAEELLKTSGLVKYETENSKKLDKKPFDAHQKDADRADKSFKVQPQSKKSSSDETRLAEQVRPGSNPKEKAEGNNEPYGKEPKNLGKAENPDKEADAKLGEKVEHDVEEHMLENKAAEEKEGHKIFDKSEDAMDKHGLSPEEIDERLKKTGLSPDQIKEHLEKKAKGAYPQELASRNIEEEMHHEWPGGKKQAVAVGINEAREGKDVSKASEDTSAPQAFVPIKHHHTAKLAKFMEWKHFRKKNAS